MVNQATLVLTLKRIRYLITMNPECIIALVYYAHNKENVLNEANMQAARRHKFFDESGKMEDAIAAIIRCSLKGPGIDVSLCCPLHQ